MEALEILHCKLKQPTDNISQDILQGVVIAVKKLNPVTMECEKKLDDILLELWTHMAKGFEKFDDQLLCSTTFFSVLTKTNLSNFYLPKIDIIIKNMGLKRKDFYVISLIYGIFQSSYFMNETLLEKNFNALKALLKSAFNLLFSLAYDYTQYTFIVFKTMTSLRKIIGTKMEDTLFNKENQLKLLSMVNHNWENPITGIRNMNRTVFQIVLSVLDEATHKEVLKEINKFYWNKAKFLMLTEIIERFNDSVVHFVNENLWIVGLLASLHQPGMVSAGTDMYFAILKKLRSESEWKILFFNGVVEILCGDSKKAVENFSNYWCLSTLKKFPELLTPLAEALQNCQESQMELYSILLLWKHGCKLGLLKKQYNLLNDDYEVEIILGNLKHCTPAVRMVPFEILCISTDKSMPPQTVYDGVLEFLWENINSDCTVLRLSMLNNFSIFLSKLHILFINNFNIENDSALTNFQSFCKELQHLIIQSFKIAGNYQRKITTIRLTELILKKFTQIDQKKRKQTKNVSITLKEFLKSSNNWYFQENDIFNKLLILLRDPARDVHEGASQILLTFYIEEISNATVLTNLLTNAFECIHSKFFYESSCGQVMFQLINNILAKKNVEAKFPISIEGIFNIAYSNLENEYNTQNIVDSIGNGKELHSYINIIYGTIKVCLQHSYKIKITNETILNLINILDHVSNQFAWEKESVSSDFCKMSDMVQSLIDHAGYSPKNADDETKISGLYQLVLNCLWLNVKASCELSSLLIQYNMDAINCKRSLRVITHVLETSRHKGAIEAAGVALGDAIRYLTTLPDDDNLSKIPFTLLEEKLNELINEANRTSSITRRGAGLSIMVHRIVSNDNSKGKPLFHYFMKVLLSTCNRTEGDHPILNCNKEDLPRAIYIHFLTRIVMDSSLASDTMFYATELGELAFKNLTDEHWQIRNAALQLYGALVPKLIGQKKACGEDDKTMATVACDEFKTHFPTLWRYIEQRIQEQHCGDKIQTHSNLVPILNIIASMGRRYTFGYDLKDHDLEPMSKNLLQLLDSPIYVVRRLTAKALTNLSTPHILDAIINENKAITENCLHGLLLLVTYFNKYHCTQYKIQEIIKKLVVPEAKHSFLCRMYYDPVIHKENSESPVDYIKYVLNEVDNNRYAPGVFVWANNKIEICIKICTWCDMPMILMLLLKYNDFRNCCQMIYNRIDKDENIPEIVLIEIAQILLNSTKSHSIIWNILYLISIKCCLHKKINSTIIKGHLKSGNIYSKRFLIPLAARIFAKNKDNNNLLLVANMIFKLSNPATSDIDMRNISAVANNEIACEFSILPDNIKIICIETVVILLQDEEEDIRQIAAHFYSHLKKTKKIIQPFVCLNRILDIKFILEVLDNPSLGVKYIFMDLTNFIYLTNVHEEKIYKCNPFANDAKNIYMETMIFERLLENLNIY